MGNEIIQRFTGPPPPAPPLFVSMILRGFTTSGRLGLSQGGITVLAVNAGARAPRGGVTRQGVVLTDLQSLLDCRKNLSLSLSLSLSSSSSSSAAAAAAAAAIFSHSQHQWKKSRRL
jgi:hypothetical protein